MGGRLTRAQRNRQRRATKARLAADAARHTAHRIARIEREGLPAHLFGFPPPPPATTGPFDQRDAPDAPGKQVDLGSLRIPATPGTELRLDARSARLHIDLSPGTPVAATITLQVFAVPRSATTWVDERREVLIEEMSSPDAGPASVIEGKFGPEIHGAHTSSPGRRAAPSPMKIMEIEGPRWHMEARYAGAAMGDNEIAQTCDDLLSRVVVVRGRGALPPGTPLPLTLSQRSAEDAAPRRRYATL